MALPVRALGIADHFHLLTQAIARVRNGKAGNGRISECEAGTVKELDPREPSSRGERQRTQADQDRPSTLLFWRTSSLGQDRSCRSPGPPPSARPLTRLDSDEHPATCQASPLKPRPQRA